MKRTHLITSESKTLFLKLCLEYGLESRYIESRANCSTDKPPHSLLAGAFRGHFPFFLNEKGVLVVLTHPVLSTLSDVYQCPEVRLPAQPIFSSALETPLRLDDQCNRVGAGRRGLLAFYSDADEQQQQCTKYH